MTGLDCLKDELIKRGFTKQQADSKVVIGVLDIIAQADGQYIELGAMRDELERLRVQQELEQSKLRDMLKQNREIHDLVDGGIADINEKADKLYRETRDYIDEFYRRLNACETEAGRDAMRIAQFFVNSVDVDTKYDNTAFIIGLAAILTGKAFEPIAELHKINADIPRLRIESRLYGDYPGGKRYQIYSEKVKEAKK
jgi:hypothetical protein